MENAARSPFCSSSMWQLDFCRRSGTALWEELPQFVDTSKAVGYTKYKSRRGSGLHSYKQLENLFIFCCTEIFMHTCHIRII